MVIKIEDLKAGKWANLEVTVKEIWDNEHAAIRQVGIMKRGIGILLLVIIV